MSWTKKPLLTYKSWGKGFHTGDQVATDSCLRLRNNYTRHTRMRIKTTLDEEPETGYTHILGVWHETFFLKFFKHGSTREYMGSFWDSALAFYL